MSRTGVRVVDMTARLGGLAIGQTGATLSTTESRQAIALSATPGMPTIDWVRPPYPNDDLEAADGPAALLVIVGPGSVHGALDLLRRAWAADVPAVRLLLMPSAIVEDMTFSPLVTAATPSTLLYRLPDSSPETLWFVLIEEFNKLTSRFGLSSLQPTPSLHKDPMSNLKQSIDAAMTIDGALAAALVDFRSGMCLAQAGTAVNLDLAAAGNTQVVRAKLQTMESLGLRKGIEDILITLTDQYHLIRLVPNNAGLFLYLVLDKNKGNLALARYKLTEIERSLQV